MAITKEIIIKADTSDAVKGIDNLNDSLEDVNQTQGKVSSSAKKQSSAIDSINAATGGAVNGFKAMIKQMWLIVANPVGLVIAAIVLGLTALFKAFTSTKAGAEKFDQVMAGISATIDVVRDRVLKIGEALVKFFTGDFKGAMEVGREAVAGFGEEVAREFKIAADAKKSLQEVADAMRDLSVTRAELDRDLAESERILTSTTASYRDKKKALEEVEAAEKKQTDAELENARKKLKAIQDQNDLSDSDAGDLDAEADARIAVIELEKLSSENRRKVADFNKTLDNEEAARIKDLQAKEKARADARREELDSFSSLQQELKTSSIDSFVDELDQKEALQKEANQNKLSEDLRVQDQTLTNARLTAEEQKRLDENVANAKVNIASNTAGLISQLVEQDSALGKGVALAQATISGFQGVQSAFTTASASPITTLFPAYPFIQAGLAGAFSAVQVKNILSVNPKTGAGASAGGSSGGGGGASAPSFNLVEGTGSNQIAEGLQSQDKPIKAFVVSSDVSTSQSLDRNIVQNSSL